MRNILLFIQFLDYFNLLLIKDLHKDSLWLFSFKKINYVLLKKGDKKNISTI